VSNAARIHQALDSIARDYSPTLEPARRGASSHATSVTPQPPAPVAILDVRATAHEVLAYWSGLVIKGQHLQHLPAVTVHDLTAFLTIHADFLAAHKWANHAITELEHSAAALAQIVADNQPRRFVVARCPVVDCDGLLRVTLRRDDDAFPSEIKCTLDEQHKWAPSQWAYMARVVS
jgi:hypothetical protein